MYSPLRASFSRSAGSAGRRLFVVPSSGLPTRGFLPATASTPSGGWHAAPAGDSPSVLQRQAFGSSLSLSSQRRLYHEAVIEHFERPRNVGKLDAKKANVGSALVGKASCGDVIKLQIEVDEADGKTIRDAKFKTFGCGSAIASSSLATEMVIGKSLDDAAALKNTDISSMLNLPPVKIHCSVLAEEAIQAAIDDYKKKQAGGGGKEEQ